MRYLTILCCATGLVGCNLLPEPPPEQNCQNRSVYYPDDDQDGVGEPTAIYVGCAPPEGWVESVDFSTPDTDVPDTDVADTDTDVADTDTDVADSDTDSADTDADTDASPDTDTDGE